MTCPEERVIAFLAGELSDDEERKFDDHLLGCEQCWGAVRADRAAHLALERLRQPAPAGLQSRVTLSVALAATEAEGRTRAAGRRRPRRLAVRGGDRPLARLAAAALVVVVAAVGLGWLATDHRSAPDPPQVAAVVAMITPGTPPTTELQAGEHFVIAGQRLMVRAYHVEGTEELVATSAQPFPVPGASHLLSGSAAHAWMATKGRLSMYGVNRRRGAESMFLVAAMPMAEMPQMAARLNLI